ncbi:MAG: phospholipase D-like domain-containing protein [Caldilineaceae bacterium]
MHQPGFVSWLIRLTISCLCPVGIILLFSAPVLAADCQPATGQLLIWAAYIDTWLPADAPLQGTDELDEAIALINMGDDAIDLAGCALSDKANHQARFPGFLLQPHQVVWAARDGDMFKTIFGFWPAFDYAAEPLSDVEHANGVQKMTSAGSTAGPLALSNGTETIQLSAADGTVLDVLPYGKSNRFSDPIHWPQAGGVAPTAGYGPLVNNIPRFSLFQIINRKIDACNGLPVADTNTMADWATDPDDDIAGRRFFRPGQDLPLYATTRKVTEAVTKLNFLVSPDNSYPEFYAEIQAAQQSIKIAGYEYAHPDIITLLIDKAATLPVQILFEGTPVEGVDPEQKYLCRQLAATTNGSGCHWIDDSFAATGATAGLIGRYRFHHAKYTLIDDKVVMVGTENPNRSSLPYETKPANGASGNRGVYIVTDAPTVVQHFVTLFAADNDIANHFDIRAWDSTISTDMPPAEFALPRLGGADRTGYTIVKPEALSLPAGEYELEVIQSPDNSLAACTRPGEQRGLLGMVSRAGGGDWVLVAQNTEEQPWGTSSTPRDNPRLLAYIAAAQRGATVRVILDGNRLNQSTCDFLNNQTIAGAGSIACLKGNPTGGTYHIKEVAVCAGGQGYVNISSINGTENANKQNRETGLQVASTEAFQYMAELFVADWTKLGGDAVAIACGAIGATPPPTATLLPTATPLPTVTPTVTPLATPPPATPTAHDDLTKIRGIGPTYAGRLYAAGITTYAALAQLTPTAIKAIVAPGRAGNFIDAVSWIAQAQALMQSSQ